MMKGAGALTFMKDIHGPPLLAGACIACLMLRCEHPIALPRILLSAEGGMLFDRPAMFSMQPIGYVRSPYQNTQEVPKGLGAKHEAPGILEILAEFEPGLKDIEGFSHLIVIWAFDRAGGCNLVGTPPTDDRPHGVFATRSPRRPNPIGLTVVELISREGPALHVQGVDMLEGTPILDLKPYLSNIPPERLRRGWLAEAEARRASRP